MLRSMCFVSFVALTSCGSDKAKKDARPPANNGTGESTGFNLQGIGSSTWLSSCLVSETSNTSTIIGYQIEDLRMARTTKVSNGNACEDKDLYAIRVANYNETRISDTAEVAGGKLVKSFFGSMTLSPESSAFAAVLNETAAYGFKDWHTKTPKDVSGLKFDVETKAEWSAGKSIELIYKVEDHKLFFAFFDDSDAPFFDETVFFTKQ